MAVPGFLKILRDEGGESYEDALARHIASGGGSALERMGGSAGPRGGALSSMRGGDSSFMNFANDSNFDVGRALSPADPNTQGRSIGSAFMALLGKGNPVNAYYADQDRQSDRNLDQRVRDIYAQRLMEETGEGGDNFLSDKELLQQYLAVNAQGGNMPRPQPRGTTFQEVRRVLPNGDTVMETVAQNAGRMQRGPQSTIRNEAGANSLQARNQMRELSDGAIQGLWDEYGIMGEQEYDAEGNQIINLNFNDNTRNQVAGGEIQRYIKALQYNPYEVGTEAWQIHEEESRELYDKLMAPLAGFGSEGTTQGDLEAAALAALGGEPDLSEEPLGPEAPPAPYEPQTYENMGRGLLPAIGGGLFDKAEQLWNLPGNALDQIKENAREMRESSWQDRQPSFGGMTSPAHDREMEAKYGPMRDRPVPAFLRGIGNSVAEPVAAFLFGSPQGDVGQDASSPASVDIGSLDARLLQHYTPLEIMQMTAQEKSEAIEKINLGG